MTPIISICITSYNRPKELIRCLQSIDVKNASDIEIVISEDKSPKREEIKKELAEFSKQSKYILKENYNEINLGYDRNLEKLISLSDGKYILFCSDDDKFNSGCLDKVLDIVRDEDIPYFYTAYKSNDTYASNRKYTSDFTISPSVNSVTKYVYDGILFSGLMFKRELVASFSADKFVNLNYFQIYLVMKMLYHYGGVYRNFELIDCIADGENGYGTTELSKKDPLLANRSSIYSNLQFNKGLCKVVKIFDDEENTNVHATFSKEYSLRTYRGLKSARVEGKEELKKYWKMLHEVGFEVKFPAGVYYRCLKYFGVSFSECLFTFPKKLLFKIRKYV